MGHLVIFSANWPGTTPAAGFLHHHLPPTIEHTEQMYTSKISSLEVSAIYYLNLDSQTKVATIMQ